MRKAQTEDVDEADTTDRVTADTDTSRLANATSCQRVDDLVGQGTAFGHDTHVARHGDVAGNDADIGLAAYRDAPGVKG